MAILKAEFLADEIALRGADLLHDRLQASYKLVHGAGQVSLLPLLDTYAGFSTRLEEVDGERARLTLEPSENLEPTPDGASQLVVRSITAGTSGRRAFSLCGQEFSGREYIMGEGAALEITYGIAPNGLTAGFALSGTPPHAALEFQMTSVLWLPNNHRTVTAPQASCT